MNRPAWDDYFLNIAEVVSSRGTCPRRQVGAVLVKDKRILATGYNGAIAGQPHCSEIGCLIENGGCQRIIHAEMNAILQAAQHGVRISGATIYTTMSPCWDCFRAIANGGIVSIVYAVEYRVVERQREFAKKCGIEWTHRGDEKYVPGRGPRVLRPPLFAGPGDCAHGVSFDVEKSRGMSAQEIRNRWPRLMGACPLGCGYSGISYASYDHFVAGDW